MTAPIESVSFTLPVLAKPWQRAGRSRKGQHYTPAETRAFEALVRDTARLKLGRSWDMDGMYELGLMFYLPDYKTRDWDNLGKAVSDALNGVAYRDDNQVTRAIVDKLCVQPGTSPSVTVTVYRIGDWPVKRKKHKAQWTVHPSDSAMAYGMGLDFATDPKCPPGMAHANTVKRRRAR